ncbi:uncharacterized protein B0I36DRAFT_331560 [Microdochium trichocladiopsis]|uniref:Rhodopsin domain-containing protein n=1 Tax=Microdochium trichocladiopsis TaxID=1682393 RepID=A0A9P9BL34_9PEZI|nr:uncharacterized protein B0I36DRAFT_331560 [Microdochium trichocladiopsis]KAH7024522.1 hypothetical protein B0I36DRAFT_331560 [Microdochium trichocladiopsis]
MTQTLPLTTPALTCLITGSLLWIAGSAVVCFRCLGRFRGAGIGVDDCLSVAAAILSGSAIGIGAAVFTSGVGYDLNPESAVYPILLENLPRILELTFAYTLIYLWALAALKLSQLFLYLRTFELELRWWIYGGIGISIAWGVSFTFLTIFLCDPIQQQWTLARIGKCKDQITVLKSLILTNVLTDLFIVILPIRTIWNLQMRKTEKVVVTLCFAMGLACCIIGIVRFVYLFEIDLLGNLTGTSQSTFILLTVELDLAVLCINIPTLRPFYARLRAKYGSFWTRSTDQGPDTSSRSQVSGLAPRSNTTNGMRFDDVSASKRGIIGTGTKKSQSGGAAWIELNDAESGAVSDDAGSERKLTRAPHPDSGVRVSTKWTVTRE